MKLVRRGQESGTHKLGSKELHIVAVGGGISVAHEAQHPPPACRPPCIGETEGPWCHGAIAGGGSLTNSHTDETQNCLGDGGVPRGYRGSPRSRPLPVFKIAKDSSKWSQGK